jgi:hypothetical protein
MRGAFSAARSNLQVQPYSLSDVMVNYENGELFGTATVNASPGSSNPDGLSIYLASADDADGPIYCEGLLGPAMTSPISIPLPASIAASTESVTLPSPTRVVLTVVITYKGTHQSVLSETFPIPPLP